MRLLATAITASLLFAAPALARSYGEIITPSPDEAHVMTTPAAQIPTLCAKIIADQNTSKAAMRDAGDLLFHGQLMGQHCVKVDYVKAITLEQQAGDTIEYNAFVKILRYRAAAGNPLAVSAMSRLNLAP